MGKRAETGVMQFEDDWPGIFVRGDNALAIAMNIEQMVHAMRTNPDARISQWDAKKLEGLGDLFRSCDACNKPDAQAAQLVLAPAAKAVRAQTLDQTVEDESRKSAPTKTGTASG